MVPRFEKRVKAYAADLSALMMAVIIGALGFQNMVIKIGVVVIVYLLVSIIPNFFSNGQTFGKRIQKIKVVNLDGTEANVFIVLLREVFKTAASILTFGIYSVIAYFLVTEKHVSRTIHDYIFKTKVIDLGPQTRKNEGNYLDRTESMKKRGL
ncbi:MAG: RDD family protein [Acholeplasma sp.]|nr:RDD family protein [Acholeplasma sp.]